MKKLIISLIIICLPVILIGQTTVKNNFVIEKTAPSLHLKGSNGIINFNSGDVTLTNTSNVLTIVGGVLALPANGLLINSINHLYGITDTISQIYAPLVSPAFTGVPKISTDTIATKAYARQVGGTMTYPASGIALSTGSAWESSITNNSANWNTAYTDRLKWDGGVLGLVAADGRTSLGGTTVGQAFFTLTNPSAIRVPIIQTNNTITATATTGTGNVVLSASPTLSGTVVLGSGSLTMTGSLAATGSRVLKGWFTDLEVTNLPTVNGNTLKSALSLTSSDVGLGNVTNESKATMFTSPTFTGTVSGITSTMVGLGNVTNKKQVEVEDSTGVLSGNYTPRLQVAGMINDSLNARIGEGVDIGDIAGIKASFTTSLTAGVLTDIILTGVTSEPYSILILDSSGNDITHSVKDSVALNGGVYKLYVYSVDELTGCKLKILY